MSRQILPANNVIERDALVQRNCSAGALRVPVPERQTFKNTSDMLRYRFLKGLMRYACGQFHQLFCLFGGKGFHRFHSKKISLTPFCADARSTARRLF